MHAEQVPKIIATCRQIFGQRVNAEATLTWAEQHPLAFVSFVDGIDLAVEAFNKGRVYQTPLPEYAINVLEVKEANPRLRLPLLSALIRRHRITGCAQAQKGLKEAEQMMLRGETTKEEPYLNFHVLNIDPEARLIGALYDLYPALLTPSRAERIGLDRDQIVDILVETTVSPGVLRDALWNPARLDWVRDWAGLGPEFRKLVGEATHPPAPDSFPTEPYKVKGVASPQKIFQQVAALGNLEYLESVSKTTKHELRLARRNLSVNLAVWGGRENINAWLRRYDPDHQTLSETYINWDLLNSNSN
jgi:hypothetical protein